MATHGNDDLSWREEEPNDLVWTAGDGWVHFWSEDLEAEWARCARQENEEAAERAAQALELATHRAVYNIAQAISAAGQAQWNQYQAERRAKREQWEAEHPLEAAQEYLGGHRDVAYELKKKIGKHLRSAAGRNGEDAAGLAEILDREYYRVLAVLHELRDARAVKEDQEYGVWFSMAEWYRRHPGAHEPRRGLKEAVGMPKKVYKAIHAAGGREAACRKAVATALQDHFYATRKSWKKARAVGVRKLAAKAGVSKQTASNVVAWLNANGLIEIVATGQGRRGSYYRWPDHVRDYRSRATVTRD